jgi:hypothetical protein
VETRQPQRAYKYYDLIMVGFVAVILCSNLITAPKRVELFGFVFGAGVIFFPISYIFGDILTEVYGYARSRKVVWAGFGAMAFASLVSWTVVNLPPDPKWRDGTRKALEGEPNPARRAELLAKYDALPPELKWDKQRVWETVFANTPRIALASLIAFLCGEFANSYVMARMKVLSNGKRLWMRTIASTVVGELVDSAIYLHLAFLGDPSWSLDRIWMTLGANYILKVGNEVVMTPVTYAIVGFLKKAENEDYYDRDTDFTPFSLKT